MVLKERGFNQAERLPANAHAHRDVFQARLSWQEMVRLNKGCHHGAKICHPKSVYVTTKLHGTSTCRCNNKLNAISQTELCSSFLPSTYVRHVNLTAAKP